MNSQENAENRWWHDLPKHSVGDLVVNKTRYLSGDDRIKQIFLVVEAKPPKPCRVQPVQKIRLVRCSDGWLTRWSKSEGWEALENK